MSQTYQQRVSTRPHWRTYKNRKRELRRQVSVGLITAEERASLQAIARSQYEQGQGFHGTADWCAAHCQWAVEPYCKCQCEGAHHGIAVGARPVMTAETLRAVGRPVGSHLEETT